MTEADAGTLRVRLTWLMVAAMVATWLAALSLGVDAQAPAPGDLVSTGGNLAAKTRDGQWWRLVTAALVHAGWLHLAINAGMLLVLGTVLERRTGRAGIVALLVGSTVTASAASLAWSPYAVSVGASGAISGVCGALVVALIRARGTFTPRDRAITAMAVAAFVGWGAMLVAFYDSVDHAAHGAGLLTGLVLGLLIIDPAGSPRPFRAAAGLAIAAVTTVVVIATARPPLDFDGSRRELNAIDERFDRILAGAGRRPEGPVLGRRLEVEILVPLRAAIARGLVDDRMPTELHRQATALASYASLRLRALELFVRFLDTGDETLAIEIDKASALANAALDAVMVDR